LIAARKRAGKLTDFAVFDRNTQTFLIRQVEELKLPNLEGLLGVDDGGTGQKPGFYRKTVCQTSKTSNLELPRLTS